MAHSFWIANCAIDFGIVFLGELLESQIITAKNELLLHRISLSLELFTIFILGVWQVVGLWHSASRYLTYSGSRVWGRGTQALVVLWATVMTLTYPVWAPYYSDGLRIALEDKEFQYSLSISEDGTILQLDGGLGLGVTRAVSEHLYHNPDVQLLELNSRGGLLQESRDLAALIEERELSTYSSGVCLSTCTIPFLAGKQRILHGDARLGFQKSRLRGMPEYINDLRNAPDKELMLKQGIHEDFVENAFSSSNKDMWIPTLQEMLDAGAIMRILGKKIETIAYSNIAGPFQRS